jgi:hypothetical protein
MLRALVRLGLLTIYPTTEPNLYVRIPSGALFDRSNYSKHTSGVDFTTPVHVPTVTIPKADHDSLVRNHPQI